MDKFIFQQMIEAITSEQLRRDCSIQDLSPEEACDQILYIDEPFINELCLIVLVVLRHYIERELLVLAARTVKGKQSISMKEFKHNLKTLCNMNKKGDFTGINWEKVNGKINHEKLDKFYIIDCLRVVSNCYKHNIRMAPNKELLELLSLDQNPDKYDSLIDSKAIQSSLARIVDVNKNASYKEIFEKFIEVADAFLKKVAEQAKPCKISRKPVSLNPNEMLI